MNETMCQEKEKSQDPPQPLLPLPPRSSQPLHHWRPPIGIPILPALIHQNERLLILPDPHRPKQPHQLRQAQLIQHLGIVNRGVNGLALAVLQRLQFLVDAVLDDEAGDEGFGGLADAEDAAEGLLLDAAVPPQVDADDAGGHGEVEPDAAAFEGGDHDLRGPVVAERRDGVVAGFVRHFAVVVDKGPAALLEEPAQHFHAVLQLAYPQVRELMTR